MFLNWLKKLTINSVDPIILLERQRNSWTDQTRLDNQIKLANQNLRIQKGFDLIGLIGDPEDEKKIDLIWSIRAPVCKRVSILWDQWGAWWNWSVLSASKESYITISLTCAARLEKLIGIEYLGECNVSWRSDTLWRVEWRSVLYTCCCDGPRLIEVLEGIHVVLLISWLEMQAILSLGVTARQDPTATHPILQHDHYAIGVVAPWWLHAW